MHLERQNTESFLGVKTADLLYTGTELDIQTSLCIGGVGLHVNYIDIERWGSVQALHPHWI